MKEYFSLGTFLKKYKNDEACLDHIKEIKYRNGVLCDKCQRITNFTKIEGRPVYQCAFGHQISPLAGTIFEKTTTPLQYWFYAIFIMTQTRSGVSAKALQRELGVTYKTAWRMFKQIRILMANANKDGTLLDGIVEVDETFMGGKGINRAYKWMADKKKETVIGMVERKGKAYLKHLSNSDNFWVLINQVKENVSPKAFVMTDEHWAYRRLKEQGFYHHYAVEHSNKEYVRGKIHTQNIENVWSILKRGIYGVYRVVSKKYLQAYIDEYAWRYNNRKYHDKMFDLLLKQIAEVRAIPKNF